MTIVQDRGATLVVQWEKGGFLQRGLLPVAAVHEGMASAEDLEGAVKLSVDWAKHIKITLTPAKVEAELKQRGIFTVADWEKDSERVKSILLRLVMQDFIPAIRALKE